MFCFLALSVLFYYYRTKTHGRTVEENLKLIPCQFLDIAVILKKNDVHFEKKGAIFNMKMLKFGAFTSNPKM